MQGYPVVRGMLLRLRQIMQKTAVSGLLVLVFIFSVVPFLDASEDQTFAAARRRMVEKDLKGRDIADSKVLEIMGRVPRHLFVEKSQQHRAYADRPLPIGEGQTISQPYIVALMTQILQIKPGEKVLEIGTGSGYQAAILAELTDQVFSIEIKEKLAQIASQRLKELGYDRVRVKHGDGYLGWPEFSPFDAIIITCAVSPIPPPLISQLKEGGRLVVPMGRPNQFQTLSLVTKKGGQIHAQELIGVAFVPMTGEAQNQ
jgi:protein-L-isoaspartate(D-aspartate) O-methyltransferase